MNASLLLPLLLAVTMTGEYTPTSDGAPNDENIPATYAANRVVGDIYAQGADHPSQRLVDTVVGAGLFTTNSDPSVVGVDPLTGEDAPAGTDVGFGAAVRRYIQTGVLNGDFALPPPDPSQPISDTNPLPYWTWTPPADGLTSAFLANDSTYASGHKLAVTYDTGAVGVGTLDQIVPLPMSQGQQYRVLLSVFPGTSNLIKLRYQYLALDATTTVGSEVEGTTTSGNELKLDAGLVPTTAAFIRVRIYVDTSLYIKPGGSIIGEVRAAFLPAEATVGLASRTSNTGAITTTETQVVGITVPAGTFTVGSTYRIKAHAVASNSSGSNRSLTLRLRIGTASLSGTALLSPAPNIINGAGGEGFSLEYVVTIRSTGASGTAIANGTIWSADANPLVNTTYTTSATSTSTVDTTVANYLELTAQTGNAGASVTFIIATIECVMAS